MLKKLVNALRKQYYKIRVFTKPHPHFTTFDRIKLSKLKKGTAENGFITIKPYGWNQRIKLRKNYTDREVVDYVLVDQYHLPPPEAIIPKHAIILDMGSNIGLTIAHMKQLYPSATIYGFEMNEENFKLAKHNTRSYHNVHLFNKAIWITDGTVSYSNKSEYDAFSIENNVKEDDQIQVESVNINSIIKAQNLDRIDYIKMDIEGAEKNIFLQDDMRWLDYVNCINIELHLEENEAIDLYIDRLQKHGFKAWKDTKHWSSIMAIKP
ncbi:MAG: FkbM family methyltransferase [Winogradskyella sp.]|nr:FkbM family methyltransferase [Winogradskyella sp.]NNK40049.1 FkbM family methyltransferase [Winogradskyella sp.]